MLKQKKIRTNKVNGKSYIGSSVDLGRRFSNYFSPKHLQNVLGRSESLIYRALLKYSYSNFKLEVEYCKPEECLAKEQECLDRLEHEYNILPTAGSLLGFRHTEAIRQKMREAWKDSARREARLAHLAKATIASNVALIFLKKK